MDTVKWPLLIDLSVLNGHFHSSNQTCDARLDPPFGAACDVNLAGPEVDESIGKKTRNFDYPFALSQSSIELHSKPI
jgi:hypothetical protein